MCPFPSRFLNRDASFFDLCLYALWPRQFQSRDNFSSPAKTVRHASLCLYELPRRLDNRVSSSSALSETRRIFLRYLFLVHCTVYGCCNFMRVLSLNWNYGMCSARYIKIAARCTTRLARSRSPINRVNERHVPVREHIHLERSVRLVVFLHDGQTVPLISVVVKKLASSHQMVQSRSRLFHWPLYTY